MKKDLPTSINGSIHSEELFVCPNCINLSFIEEQLIHIFGDSYNPVTKQFKSNIRLLSAQGEVKKKSL